MPPLRVAVLGAGAFGRHHLRIYRELEATGSVRLAAVVDTSATSLQSPDIPESTATFDSLDGLIAEIKTGALKLDAASVCLPTKLHAKASIALLEVGVNVLVEKPMASTLSEADAMIAAAQAARRVLQVGHLERFNPAVHEVFRHLSRPMFFEVHRLSIFTPRSLDVDVVLDLMIHDLDIVLQMARSPVSEVRAVGLPVLSARTDIANVRLEFESGCVANLTASRVSTETVRKLRFFQPHQYISLDYAKQEAFQIDVQPGDPAAPDSGALPSSLAFQKYEIHRAEPLKLEIEAFLEAVRNNSEPAVTAQQARAALNIALQISEQIAEHRQRAGI